MHGMYLLNVLLLFSIFAYSSSLDKLMRCASVPILFFEKKKK